MTEKEKGKDSVALVNNKRERGWEKERVIEREWKKENKRRKREKKREKEREKEKRESEIKWAFSFLFNTRSSFMSSEGNFTAHKIFLIKTYQEDN